MTVIVLDQMRSVTAVDNGPTTEVVVSQAGMQGPQGNPTVVNGKSGSSITLNAADVGAVALASVGVANGVPSLDSNTLVPIAQLPLSSLAGNFVDLATAQTVNGVKTFGSIPVGPASDPTTSNQLSRKAYVDAQTALKLSLSGGTMTGALTLAADPTTNLQAATKQYVDAAISGLNTRASVVAATTGALPSNTYANGASGVGATLTGNANGALAAQDGVTLTVNQSLLVMNEATGSHNGIYTLTQVGDSTHPYILTRRADSDQASEIPGAFVFVETGTVNNGSGWTVASAGPFVIGTTAITWTQFSGAGEISVGTGLTKTGNQISLSTPVSIANGGTGSATQNFVDLTTGQTIAGNKTISNLLTVNNQIAINRTSDSSAINITYTTTTNSTNSAIAFNAVDSAGRLLSGTVAGDTVGRYLVDVNGTHNWGSGSATRDATMGRAAAKVLYIGTTLLLGASATLGSGTVGGLELANATTTPTGNPTGGGVFYAKSGVPSWVDTGGRLLGMVRTYDVSATSDLNTFNTETDVPGCSVSVVVTGSNATILVDGTFDCLVNGGACTMNGFLNWNGSDQARQAVYIAAANGNRGTVGQTWRITGVTAGTYVCKLRASCSVSNSGNAVKGTHTSMSVMVVEN